MATWMIDNRPQILNLLGLRKIRSLDFLIWSTQASTYANLLEEQKKAFA